MTKQLKRKKEIKNLFNRIKSDFDLNEIPLNLRIVKKGFSSKMVYRYNTISAIIIKITIVISLEGLAKRVKRGFSENHYTGRDLKLNPIIKNNRHNAYRFIILHELAHSLDLIKISGLPKYLKLSLFEKENFADNYALANLKRF